ncbi:MAG: class I SAM-dependent methyltransferase [Akkermansiaceae bacterium]|nr:class I SAM-dependent methyltransferase [Akkermansiaceae bacterium]
MKRIVVPELLDSLPADDAEAQRSRRDLRRINFLMGNDRWVLGAIRKFSEAAGRGIIEIGTGDGFLCGKMAGLFPGVTVLAYDLAPRPGNLSECVVWQQGDLFEMPPPRSGGVLIANLFLHHFEGAALTALGKWMESV